MLFPRNQLFVLSRSRNLLTAASRSRNNRRFRRAHFADKLIRSRTVNFLPPLFLPLVLSRSRKDKLAIPERTVPPFYLHPGSFIFIFIFISAFRRRRERSGRSFSDTPFSLFFFAFSFFMCFLSLSPPSLFPLILAGVEDGVSGVKR